MKKLFALMLSIAMVVSMFAGVAFAAAPAANVTGVAFSGDTDSDAGQIAGTVSWTPPADVTDVDGYRVYFADSADAKVGDTPVGSVLVGTNSFVVPANTAIPATAEKFGVVTYNADGEYATLAVIPFVDIDATVTGLPTKLTRAATPSGVDPSTKVYSLTGTVMKSGVLFAGVLGYSVSDGVTVTPWAGVSVNSQINISIPVKDVNPAATALTVTFTGVNIAPVVIPLVYNVTLTNSPVMAFGTTPLVAGQVTDIDGYGVPGVPVEAKNSVGTSKGTFTTLTGGVFAFQLGTVDGAVSFYAAGSTTASLVVPAIAENLYVKTFGTTTVTHTVAPATINLDVSSVSGTGAKFETEGSLRYTLTGVRISDAGLSHAGFAIVAASSVKVDDYYTTLVLQKLNTTNYALTFTGTFLNEGTLTVSAAWQRNTAPTSWASPDRIAPAVNISVISPDALNVFGVPNTASVGVAITNLTPVVRRANGTQVNYLEYWVEGPGITKNTVAYRVLTNEVAAPTGYTNNIPATLTPTQGGTITVTIRAYTNGLKTTYVGEVVRTITVSGYNITVNPATVQVNTFNNIEVLVTWAGQPINNATVTLDGVIHDGVTFPVTDGKYVFNNTRFTTLGNKALTVAVGTTTLASTNVRVTGAVEYLFANATTQVLAGKNSTVTFQLTNAAGTLLTGDLRAYIYDSADVSVQGNLAFNATTATYTWANYNKTANYTLVVKEGVRTGTHTITAVKPVVELTKTSINAGFTETVKATVKNPLTGEIVAATMQLIPVDATLNYLKIHTDSAQAEGSLGGATFNLVAAADRSFTFIVRAKETNTLDTVAPALTFKVGYIADGGAITATPVEEVTIVTPTLSISKTELVLEQQNTVEVTAMGGSNPVVDKPIYVNGALVGYTDDAGKMTYYVRPSATGRITFELGNDWDVTINSIAAPARARVQATVVLPPVTPPAPAPIVIALGQPNPAIGLDVAPAIVNGRTMVPFRWFGERVLGIATENITWNEANGSVTMIHGGTTVILTINSVTASVNGQAVQLDAAPFITGGRTLVPARFLAETFGFTITWDSVTNNVTIVKN